MPVLFFIVLFLFVSVLQICIPYIVKGSIVFGVTVPDQLVHDVRLVHLKKKYSMIIAVESVVVLAVSLVLLMQNVSEAVQVAITLTAFYAPIVVSVVVYFIFHAKVQRWKREESWGMDLQQVRVVDTTVRERDEMVPWTFLVLPMILSISLMVYTWLNYHLVPEQVPIHWGISGLADNWTKKTWVTAVAMPVNFLFMQWMFAGAIDAMKRSGIRLSANMKEQSIVRQLEIRKFSSWFFVGLTYVLTIVMTVVQLSIIHEQFAKSSILLPVFVSILVCSVGGTLLYAWKMYKLRLKYPKILDSKITDVDEDQYWKGGLIYYNPNDPSIFVEKRFGIGWTMNMANKRGYITFALPLALLLVFSLWVL